MIVLKRYQNDEIRSEEVIKLENRNRDARLLCNVLKYYMDKPDVSAGDREEVEHLIGELQDLLEYYRSRVCGGAGR